MSRRELRELIFKLLFRVEFNQKEELAQQEVFFFEDEENQAEEEYSDQVKGKFRRIVERLDEIDAMLNEKAKGWSTNRMGKVDLTILRLAVFEIKYDEEIPTGVAINEAVELAKKFSSDEAPAFINGILGKVARGEA